MAKRVQTFDLKSGHRNVTSITQNIPGKFRSYFIPFRVQKRSKFPVSSVVDTRKDRA